MPKNSQAPIIKRIFDYAPETKQYQTAIQFIDKVVDLAGPHSYQQKYAHEIRDIVKNGTLSVRQSLISVIAAFDCCLLDEIRCHYKKSYYSWTDDAAEYYRFNAYDSWTPPEIITALSNTLSIEINHIVIGFHQHIASLYSDIGTTGELTPDFSFWVNSDKPYPPCCVSRQELFLSFLKCGINPLKSIPKPSGYATIKNTSEPDYFKSYKRRSQLFAKADIHKIDDWIIKTGKRWRDLMNSEGYTGELNALLFNSGTSANEAVLRVLTDITSGLAYKNYFWYFENIKSFGKLFKGRITSDYTPAQIVCLNLEPTNYFRWPEISADIDPLTVIAYIVQNARENRDKKFYLVLDITVDPLFSVTDVVDSQLPENLVVIKTVSVTKHQDGMRNYFFGAVLVFCHDGTYLRKINNLIKKNRSTVGGNLLDSHKVHFPRQNKHCLTRRKNYLAHLMSTAAEAGTDMTDWLIVPHTMHFYILPPIRLAKYITKFFQNTDRYKFVASLKKDSPAIPLIEMIHRTVSDFERLNIEIGDSLGLAQTRIKICRGFGIIKGDKYSLNSIRICPGFKTDEKNFADLIIKLLERMQSLDDEQLFQLVDIHPLVKLNESVRR